MTIICIYHRKCNYNDLQSHRGAIHARLVLDQSRVTGLINSENFYDLNSHHP